MAGVTLNPQLPEAMLVMFTVKRLVHHLTVKLVKNQSGIHDVLRTHGANAGLAQLVEPFTCNEKVIRSSRISSSSPPIGILSKRKCFKPLSH